MKHYLPNPSSCKPGQEQYADYYSQTLKGRRVQYDYRTPEGKLFSTVAPTLEDARRKRDEWLAKQAAQPLYDASYGRPEGTL